MKLTIQVKREVKDWLEYHLERSSWNSTNAIISCLIGCVLQGYKWQQLELWEIPGYASTSRYARHKRQYKAISRSEKAQQHLLETGRWTPSYQVAIGKVWRRCPICNNRY